MTPDNIRELLEKVKAGDLSVDDATETMRHLPFDDIGIARVDTHRELRQGMPEVILGSSKTREDIRAIMSSLLKAGSNVMITRIAEEVAGELLKEYPDAKYHLRARVFVYAPHPVPKHQSEKNLRGKVLIITAGTSDIPIAEEAAVTVDFMGSEVESLYDVGVAGIHRLLDARETLAKARVIIVVAGMEGALASVVGGLVSVPVIAVPTSVGYGASFGGLAALLGMLNTCAAGVTVVNIDNGFGAGCAAHLMNRL